MSRVALTVEEEIALLAERVPPEVLNLWGPALIDSIRQLGLNRRTALLTLTRRLHQDVALPVAVTDILWSFWAAENGALALLPQSSCDCNH